MVKTMKLVSLLFCYLVIAILLNSCTSKNSFYDVSYSNPIVSRPYIEPESEEDKNYIEKLLEEKINLDNNLNYEILRTIYSKESGINKESYLAMDLLGRLTKANLNLDIVKKDNQLPSNFLNFLPSPNDSFNLELIESSKSYDDIVRTLSYNSVKKKYRREKNYCRTQKVFTIKTSTFPNNFYFPKDYLSTQFFCGDYLGGQDSKFVDFTRNEFRERKYYLVLTLPDFVELPVLSNYYSLESLKTRNSGEAAEEQSNQIKEFLDENYNELYKYTYSKKRLLLEPAFESFDRNVSFLWNLYLLKINYKILSDTLKVDEGVYGGGYYEFVIPPLKFSKKDDLPRHENQKTKIRNYLLEDFSNNQEIYKSYFELVLWKMYECSAFTLNRKNPEKASFTFTSNNPKYSGNFEVLFSIYEPNLFKVAQR